MGITLLEIWHLSILVHWDSGDGRWDSACLNPASSITALISENLHLKLRYIDGGTMLNDF